MPGSSARLTLHKIERVGYQPLEWVPLIDLPDGDGLVYMTTLAGEEMHSFTLKNAYTLHDLTRSDIGELELFGGVLPLAHAARCTLSRRGYVYR